MLHILDFVFIAICLVGSLSGCGQEQLPSIALPTPTVTQNPADTSAPSITLAATATPTPTPTATPVPTVTLTVYSRTIVIVTQSGGVDNGLSLSGTGYCTVYNGVTYCWDDGIKRFPHQNNADGGGRTYWALMVDTQHYPGNGLALCPNIYEYCTSDRLSVPTTINANVTSVLNQNSSSPSAYRTTAQVFAGSSQQVTCTDDGSGVLGCGSFSVDTNQVGLQ